ncbi:MAG TPA: hypothetical protein DD379_11520, partial [Cyanobacteria bacterium UBA11162]|nr:hypothetical protein [Cyanobacteria bacterium UBA11162]
DGAKAWVGEKVTPAINWLTDKGNSLMSTIQEKGQAFASSVREKGSAILQWFSANVNSAISGLEGAKNSAVSGLRGAVNNSSQWLDQTSSSVANYIEEKGSSAATLIDEGSTNASNFIEEKGNSTATFIDEKSTDVAKWLEDKNTTAANLVETAGNNTATFIDEKSTNAANFVEDKGNSTATFIDEKSTNAANFVEDKGNKASQLVDNYGNKAVDFVDTAGTYAIDFIKNPQEEGQKLLNKAGEGIQAAWEWSKEKAGQAADWSQEKINWVSGKVNENIIQPATGWVQEQWGKLQSWMESTFPGLTRCWKVFEEYSTVFAGYLQQKAEMVVKWWNETYPTISAWGHGILDVIGIVGDAFPGVGNIVAIVADILNTIWYAAEGDWVNAGLSAIAIIPYIGTAAKGGKYLGKGLKYVDDVVKLVGKYGDDVIKLFSKYGTKIGELFVKYGEDVIKVFVKYGDEAFQWLAKYGDDVIPWLAKQTDKASKFIDDALEKIFGKEAKKEAGEAGLKGTDNAAETGRVVDKPISISQGVKIGDETHTLSIRQVGGKPSIYLCSDCGPLLNKIDAGLNDPNLSDAVKLQLTGLGKRVRKFDVSLKKGKLSNEAIEQELQSFRRELEEISESTLPITNKFPNEALDPDGKIFGEVKVVDGKVTLDGRNVPREVDFVITTDNRLIIGRKHTTLSNKADVLAAGNIKINGQGKIIRIDNKSGHFRPTVQESARVPTLLREMGLDLSGTNIQLYRFTIDSDGMVQHLTKLIDESLK